MLGYLPSIEMCLPVTGIASLTHSLEASGASKTPSHAYTLLVLGVFIRLA